MRGPKAPQGTGSSVPLVLRQRSWNVRFVRNAEFGNRDSSIGIGRYDTSIGGRIYQEVAARTVGGPGFPWMTSVPITICILFLSSLKPVRLQKS
jgi:hypothetical protein